MAATMYRMLALCQPLCLYKICTNLFNLHNNSAQQYPHFTEEKTSLGVVNLSKTHSPDVSDFLPPHCTASGPHLANEVARTLELPLLQWGAHGAMGKRQIRGHQISVPDGGSNMPTWPEMWHETCGLSSSPDSAAEEHWLLGNDGEFAPEVSKADITDSHSVDLDTASR